jgi:CRISPR-associated endonuclease/helicase Cas3
MATNVLLAHSPRPRQGIPGQTYLDHVTNVRRAAVSNAQNAAAYYCGDSEAFNGWVDAAALYHDLGKIDNENQAVLQQDSRERLPIAHEDAGVTELDKLGHQEAVVIAYGHHAGLFSRNVEMAKQGRPFRELTRFTPDGDNVAAHVDRKLKDYEKIHMIAGCPELPQAKPSSLFNCGLTRRIALSCLVDADHGDTARHYRNEIETPQIEPRWKERLEALEQYVYGLDEGKTNRERNRNLLRKRMFEVCRDAPLDPSIRTCDAPVGSGKTTAVMAHLMRVAAEHDPQLRHIIVVLPYTNIISQSVEIYRDALVLDGERPEDVVAEHHHRADFEEVDLRQLATLWKAPIIVTTAVQFFETLGSHHPARLRKLHELPGSAVFVDEMHAAMPSHLWPQMWRWLETWAREWSGHLVLASGSLPRFWELDEYKALIQKDKQASIPRVPDLITQDSLRGELKQLEEQRINYRRRQEKDPALDCQRLIEFMIEKKPGPRLLIVNTVQTAAVIARAMREARHNVLHLSTALAPAHRDLIVDRVKLRLRERMDDWTLVATSCVEAGMNFSFRVGFRERASTASLIQIGGRVSRGDEFENADVWDIMLLDDQFRSNPTMTISRRALDNFTLEELNRLHPAKLATCAMSREWTSGAEEKAKQLIGDEEGMEYPSVSKQCRVIEAATRTVVIDKSLAQAIQEGQRVSRVELMRYSVQIWSNKVEKLGLNPLISNVHTSDLGVWEWPYDYDPDFLGYMEGVLKIDDFIVSGGVVI